MGAMYYLIPAVVWPDDLQHETHRSAFLDRACLGIVLYITSMWTAGIMQGLMWRAVNPDGTLTYSFVETVAAMYPYYIIRLLGGVLFLAGAIVMAYNMWRTIAGAKPVDDASIPKPAATALRLS
jgi:cytochrome c oxidase cbb3-type subunit I